MFIFTQAVFIRYNTSILLIELFIANVSIILKSFKWCNESVMIELSKKKLF